MRVFTTNLTGTPEFYAAKSFDERTKTINGVMYDISEDVNRYLKSHARQCQDFVYENLMIAIADHIQIAKDDIGPNLVDVATVIDLVNEAFQIEPPEATDTMRDALPDLAEAADGLKGLGTR